MLSNNSPHSERFQKLLGEVKQEVDSLKLQLKEREKENAELKARLQEIENKEADVFSSMKETERMALKHQVKGLISKIDEHLESRS